jgi:hypothetical protein
MRLLVAEDDRKVASFLRQGLEEEGYAVEVAGDGAAALDPISYPAFRPRHPGRHDAPARRVRRPEGMRERRIGRRSSPDRARHRPDG